MEKVIWDIYGKVYDSTMLQIIPYRRMMKRAYEALGPVGGGRYLDAGCGTGNFLKLLADSNGKAEAVGVDFSRAMLRRAEKKNAGNGRQVELLALDLNQGLPFADGTFDGIVCLNVLYILKDPDFMIRELNRVLAHNGRLVLSTPISKPRILPILKEHVAVLKDMYQGYWAFYFLGFIIKFFFSSLVVLMINLFITRSKHYFFFNRSELEPLFEKNRFKIINTDIVYGEQVWLVVAVKI